jgi:hypothetical protein
LLGDFNAKVGREDIFKPTIGGESLCEISDDNEVRVVNFATSKNLSKVQCSHTVTFINLLAKIHNQIDHILIDRRRHSGVFDVQLFREQIVIPLSGGGKS